MKEKDQFPPCVVPAPVTCTGETEAGGAVELMSSRPACIIYLDPGLQQSNEKITSYQLRPEPKLLEPGVGSASG